MRKVTALSPLKKYGFKVFLAPFLKLFEVAAELLSPFLVKYIIDEGIAKNDLEFSMKMSLLLFVIALLGFCFTMGAQYLSARVAADYNYDLRKEIYSRINVLSEKQLDAFGKQKALTLVNNDSFSMQSGVNMFMRLIFRPPFLVIGAAIMTFTLNVKAGIIFSVSILLSFIVVLAVMLMAPKRYNDIQKSVDSISLVSHDSLSGARPVRAFNKEEQQQEKFSKAVDVNYEKNMKMADLNSWINPMTFLFINGAIILVVVLAFIADPNNTSVKIMGMTPGEVSSVISYLTSSFAALVMFSKMIVSLNKAAASRKRIDEFLALEPEITSKNALYEAKEDAPLIEFKDVSLTYGKEGDKLSVSNLSFQMKKGSWIGLIGGTGSGKSTTLSLLLRLYEPTSGEILYKGVPLNEYPLKSLREEISIVLQRPSIFKGTIRSNLLVAKEDATEEELIAALKSALAYDYVSKYSDFLDHEIEEGGSNLSGGQKQRLLIARALLKKSELLILDDSTSALDYLSDQQVRANISSIEGLTKIIVSQRATSLMSCDLILVYDNGRIIAQGTHEELVNSCDVYREIYDMQKGEGK